MRSPNTYTVLIDRTKKKQQIFHMDYSRASVATIQHSIKNEKGRPQIKFTSAVSSPNIQNDGDRRRRQKKDVPRKEARRYAWELHARGRNKGEPGSARKEEREKREYR